MVENWTDTNSAISDEISFLPYTTLTNRRAKLQLTLIGLIDKKVLSKQTQILRRDVCQPAYEHLLFELASYALNIYLDKIQEEIRTQRIDYKIFQRKDRFNVYFGSDECEITFKNKEQLTNRVSKHLDKLCHLWNIQVYQNLEQHIAEIVTALALIWMENVHNLDYLECLSISKLKSLMNQYLSSQEMTDGLHAWCKDQFTQLTFERLEQVKLRDFSIEELEYFLGFQTQLQLYRRLRQFLQNLGWRLEEQINNLPEAVALFQQTSIITSFKNRPQHLYQEQYELKQLLKTAEPPLFKEEAVVPVISGRLATSIFLALIDPSRWKTQDLGEKPAFAAQLITEMIALILKPLNTSLSSPYSKNFFVKLILFERFWYSTLLPILQSDQWESLHQDAGFTLTEFSPQLKQKQYALLYKMIPLYGQPWYVQPLLNLIFNAPKHLGVEVAKIHLIFCAYSAKHGVHSGFCLKGSDVIHTLGWTRNKERNRSELLDQLAKYSLILGWLNFISPWDALFSYRCLNNPVWDVSIKKITQKNLVGEELQEILIQVKPGHWVKPLLQQLDKVWVESSKNIFFLSKELLEIDSYHNRLTSKLAFYRCLHHGTYQPGRYRTSTLLELLGEYPEGSSEYDLSYLMNSLDILSSLGFSISLPNNHEALEKHLLFQPPEVDARTIKRLRRRFHHNYGSHSSEQAMVTGTQIKTARLKSGLTLEQLARKVRFSSSKLSKIENGHVLPSSLDLKKLGEFLDLP